MNWTIIGGGIHGTVLAAALLRSGVQPGHVAVVDPWPKLLFLWNRRIENCGMQFLRSPAAHGVLPEFTSLRRWARRNGYCDPAHFRPPYSRPSVSLFQSYTSWAIEHSGASACHRRATVTSIGREKDQWIVELNGTDRIVTRNVILAPGRSGTDGTPLLQMPDWARRSSQIQHILAPGFDRSEMATTKDPIIVGGGATAVHLAVSLARSGRQVRLITRTPVRVHQFDSEPCFIGPGCYRGFVETRAIPQRREMIRFARHPGSVPDDLFDEFRAAALAGRIEHLEDEITEAAPEASGVVLRGRSGTYRGGRVALGTGFKSAVPAAGLLDQISAACPTHPSREQSGIPVPDESLQWVPGVFLSGTLAELELGPTAPNIIGAHNAAKRIISYLNGRTRRIPQSWQKYYGRGSHAPESISRSAGAF